LFASQPAEKRPLERRFCGFESTARFTADAVEQEFRYPGPENGREPTNLRGLGSPFLSGINMRTRNLEGKRPRGATWYRAYRPIISGLPVSPLMRAAITADFRNGNSVPLDPRAWSFINADLTLSLCPYASGRMDIARCGALDRSVILERRDGTDANEQRR
jgi:hypothetical protein